MKQERTLIVTIFLEDHNGNTTEITTKGWTHSEFSNWLVNMYGETKIRHFDDYHYGVTVYTYNDADTKQIKEELQNIE